MKTRNKTALAAVLAALLALSACSDDAARLSELTPVSYTHPAGYQISLPTDWQISRGELGGAYAVSAGGDAVINIFPEIGGMDYHSLDDQQTIIAGMLDDFLSETALDKIMNAGLQKNSIRMLFNGRDEQGVALKTEAFYSAPFDGIHYYIFMTAPQDKYNGYSALFDDILNTFAVTMAEDEAYALFNLMEDEFTEKMAAGLQATSGSELVSLVN